MIIQTPHQCSSRKIQLVPDLLAANGFAGCQIDISGLREFQSLTVHGKELYLNTSVFTDGGMK